MPLLKIMHNFRKFFAVFCFMLLGAVVTQAQTTAQTQKDPCKEARFLALGGQVPTISAADAYKLPECFNGKLVRIFGVYRVVFENSDFYDPTENGRSWLSFPPTSSAVEKCSSPRALKLLSREDGGTFGLTAIGVFKTGGGFGHLSGWDSEFQVACVEKVIDFSRSGVLFQFQKPEVQKRILEWYARKKKSIGAN